MTMLKQLTYLVLLFLVGCTSITDSRSINYSVTARIIEYRSTQERISFVNHPTVVFDRIKFEVLSPSELAGDEFWAIHNILYKSEIQWNEIGLVIQFDTRMDLLRESICNGSELSTMSMYAVHVSTKEGSEGTLGEGKAKGSDRKRR